MLACCKTASRFFTGDLFYEENIHTHWISKDSPPPPLGKSASVNAFKFSWQFAFEETNFGSWRRSLSVFIGAQNHFRSSALSLSLSLSLSRSDLTCDNLSHISKLQLNMRICCSILWCSPTKSSHHLYFHGNKSIYNMEHLSSVLFFRGSMAAMMASSKTVLRPAWVMAEQSRKVTRLSSLTTFSACLCDTCLFLPRIIFMMMALNFLTVCVAPCRVWQIPRILVKVHLCSNKNYWGLRRLLSNFWDPF